MKIKLFLAFAGILILGSCSKNQIVGDCSNLGDFKDEIKVENIPSEGGETSLNIKDLASFSFQYISINDHLIIYEPEVKVGEYEYVINADSILVSRVNKNNFKITTTANNYSDVRKLSIHFFGGNCGDKVVNIIQEGKK